MMKEELSLPVPADDDDISSLKDGVPCRLLFATNSSQLVAPSVVPSVGATQHTHAVLGQQRTVWLSAACPL